MVRADHDRIIEKSKDDRDCVSQRVTDRLGVQRLGSLSHGGRAESESRSLARCRASVTVSTVTRRRH
eukprot:2621851-Rhodomonas_salina.1